MIWYYLIFQFKIKLESSSSRKGEEETEKSLIFKMTAAIDSRIYAYTQRAFDVFVYVNVFNYVWVCVRVCKLYGHNYMAKYVHESRNNNDPCTHTHTTYVRTLLLRFKDTADCSLCICKCIFFTFCLILPIGTYSFSSEIILSVNKYKL